MDHLPPSAAGSAIVPVEARPRWPVGAVRANGPGVVVAATAAVVLAGCSLFGGDKTDLACPRVGILGDAGRITLFAPGPGRGPTDVAANAIVGDYAGNCTYGDDGVTLDISLALIAERGPALAGSQAALEYFVAVEKPEGTIVAKQVFPTTITFPASAPHAGSREDVEPHIPLAKGLDARNYRIVLGFQLTAEQLDYNRRHPPK